MPTYNILYCIYGMYILSNVEKMMKVSKFSELTIQLLLFCGLKGGVVRITDVARAYRTSEHLIKNCLRTAGKCLSIGATSKVSGELMVGTVSYGLYPLSTWARFLGLALLTAVW
jgi:hypothetical protein